MFFDIPKFQSEDSLTAQSLRTAFKDKTAFMIQCYVSSLCNSDTRAVIPPSHGACNNDRYRRTPQFLFRMKTRVLTQGVPDTISGREQAGKVIVDVLLSSVRNEKNKAVLSWFLNFLTWRSQDLRCEDAVRQQCWWYPPPQRSFQELVINEYLHCTQSVVLLLSLHKQGLHLLR